jgi:hypothetical protein
VNFDFFIGQASLPIASLAGNSHSEWSNFLGGDQHAVAFDVFIMRNIDRS